MNRAQKKAWDCLREDEKQSLFLQKSNGKSAWESGTIMKRSHYKYIEIRERSQVFFRMFTEFFTIHESIFRPDAPYRRAFIDYIEACIEKRYDRKSAARYTGDKIQLTVKNRTKTIHTNMVKLRESDNDWDHDTWKLIVEFDRWNNFRILPRILQAPSPFRRRVNEKHKIYVKYMLNGFPDDLHEKILERYRYKIPKNSTRPRFYICLISKELYDDGYKVFAIHQDEEAVREMSRFYIYVFRDEDTADSFGFMVSNFTYKTKSIPLGQKFWAEFREIIEEAVNYNQVNNLDFNQRVFDSVHKKSKPVKKVKKSKLQNGTLKRAKDSEFYLN